MPMLSCVRCGCIPLDMEAEFGDLDNNYECPECGLTRCTDKVYWEDREIPDMEE